MKAPDILYIAQVAQDKLAVVNENYPNAEKYVNKEQLVALIEEWRDECRKNGWVEADTLKILISYLQIFL